MNAKKTRDANLDRLRTPLLFLGLLFSSAIVLTALEWKTFAEPPTPVTEMNWQDLPDELIFTAVAMKKPLPPPPVRNPVVDDYIKVDDNKPISVDLIMPDIDPIDEPIIEEIQKRKEVIPEETFAGFMVDVMPGFPGGDSARIDFLRQNLRYPTGSKIAGRQGTVWIEFVVGKDGSIEDARVLKGVGKDLDEEALRVVNQMPDWMPGRQKGFPIRVRYQMPITYTLRN